MLKQIGVAYRFKHLSTNLYWGDVKEGWPCNLNNKGNKFFNGKPSLNELGETFISINYNEQDISTGFSEPLPIVAAEWELEEVAILDDV